MPLPALAKAALLSLAFAANLCADYPLASHRYLADPTVLVHGGRVYLYCSNDDENVGAQDYLMQSLVCLSSDDMKNWTDHGIAFQVPQNAAWATRSWAPAAIARNDQFYLYFGNGGSGIGVAASDSPTGPFNDALGDLLVKWSTPGASGENMWLFDPYAFIDDDGQAYLYFGGNGESNVRVAKLNPDMVSLDGPATSITAKGFFEAAWMHKRGETYYFSYSTNPANGLRIDYLTSDNPVSGFQYAGIVADQPPSNNNNNHAGEFEFQGNWYHVYHNRFVANENGDPPGYLRNLGLEPLFYNPDGSIQQVTYTRDGVPQVKSLDPFQRVEGETFASQNGVETEPCSEGGMNLTSLSQGDWVQIRGVDFAQGAGRFTARVASENAAQIEIRLDSTDGPLVGTCPVASTGGPQTWTDVSCSIDPAIANATHDLFLVFTGETENLLNLNWWSFEAPPTPPQNLAASAVSSSQIRITWEATENASAYAILRALQAEGPFNPIAEEFTETSYTDSNLTRDTSYFYALTVTTASGTSPRSTPIKASPKQNYTEWAASTFPQEIDPASILPDADPDKDLRPNLQEYFFATNPNLPDQAPIHLALVSPDQLRIQYRQSSNLASVQATLQKSTDLSHWTNIENAPITLSQLETHDALQTTLPLTPSTLFLRFAIKQIP